MKNNKTLRLHGIRLETPTPAHAREFLLAVARSNRLHGHWVAPPDTHADYRSYLARIAEGTHIGHFVLTDDDEIAGVVNINDIVRGALQSGHLGYYALVPHARRGYMRPAVQDVVARAFRAYGLHRLEANIQPDNTASRALVQGLGFVSEGFSPRYLNIGGRWRDHERWALTAEDWRRQRGSVRAPVRARIRRVA